MTQKSENLPSTQPGYQQTFKCSLLGHVPCFNLSMLDECFQASDVVCLATKLLYTPYSKLNNLQIQRL